VNCEQIISATNYDALTTHYLFDAIPVGSND
jgi:hypothetical protein